MYKVLHPSLGNGTDIDTYPGFKNRYQAQKFVKTNLWENCRIEQYSEAPQVEAVEVSPVEAVEAPQVEAVEAPQVEAVEAPQVEAVEVSPVSFGEMVTLAMIEYETGLGLIPVSQVEAVEAPQVEAPQVEAPQVEAPQVETFDNNPVSVNFYGPKIYGKVIFDRLNTGHFVTVVTSLTGLISFRSFEKESEARKYSYLFEAPQVEAVEVLAPFHKRFNVEAPQVVTVSTASKELTGKLFPVTVEAVEVKIAETETVTYTIFGINFNKRIQVSCSKLEAIKMVKELRLKNPGFVYGLFDNAKQKNIHIVNSK